ncbi:MAG: lytic transglycosylase domain-containing protein [Acidobacteriota bacterium]|nr:lytic transglycosylase domain-containing protein [Acidobacteriota bacterium]
MALLFVTPAFAQIYSYRGKDGKLYITDRPIEKNKKDFKLVGTYVPKHAKKKTNKAKEALRERNRRTPTRKYGGAYVLTKNQIHGLVTPIARAMKVDPDLVKAVIEIESSRNVRALSNKGAQGLMQLIPETAKRFGVSNAFDPRQNIRGGVSYLQYLLSYFEGDVDLVLAAYNAGENAVDKHGGIPPYKETRRYVKKIRKLYTKEQLPYTNKARYKSRLVNKEKKRGKIANAG